MRKKSCFSSSSHTCGLTENFPSFSLLKKRNTPKLCSALLHTFGLQPIISESYSPSNQTSELLKLRLNNSGCTCAFLILFWGPLVAVPVLTPFPLAWACSRILFGICGVWEGYGTPWVCRRLLQGLLLEGKKKKGKSGYFKAEKRDSIRIGVSDVCSGGAAENQPLQHFPLLHPTLQSSWSTAPQNTNREELVEAVVTYCETVTLYW